MALKMVELHYSGRVQGVGFRFTAFRFAQDHKVSGYVRNMPDGRVELVAEGEEASLHDLIRGLNEDLGDYIEKYSINWFPPSGNYKGFSIRY
jgi:acylphosphatase